MACESVNCQLEPAVKAAERRHRWLDGMAKSKASPRATVPGLNIAITAIRHQDQRYDTCGDWFQSPGFNGLQVNVSAELSRKEQFLVAIHELIEAFLCECAGVTEASVDQFDHGHAEMALKGEEPGDCITAPYYKQHQIATGIERILAAEVGVSWLEYEKHIEELS